MFLSELNEGEKAIIVKVRGRGAFRKRILEMGFLSGKEITVVRKAPLRDPVEYNILGYNVSLRNSEASLIEVVSEVEVREANDNITGSLRNGEYLIQTARKKEKTINVAFVGNPNSGKTTLFNYASGSHERVGNYSGVTVDAKEAVFKHKGYTFNVVDLPGTYSISAYSPEELYVRNHIINDIPDVVVNVIDASNLERNLYLTTQLIDMDIRVVAALNMYDDLQKSGDTLDYNRLGLLLGIPFIPTVGSRGKGIDQLLEKLIEVFEGTEQTIRHIHINYGTLLEPSVEKIQSKIKTPENFQLTDRVSSRFLAIKLLEKDSDAGEMIKQLANATEVRVLVDKEIQRVELGAADDTETLITDAKYGFISGALRETLKPSPEKRIRKTDLLDTFITHRIWGIPVFMAFMWVTFYTTFKLGAYPQSWIETGVDALSTYLGSIMTEGPLKDLFIQGIIGGVGGVIVFLPNILLLYFFISLMEDTGYMARAVFIMDKAMHRMGLHGKSFIPLMMGFGCNVPAILSTRIIESRHDRLLTILINPFMSCSARLPVYILFIGAFFTQWQGSILFGLYAFGVLLAIGSAILFRKTIIPKAEVPFVMELPPYRMPTLRSIVKHMWFRVEQYLRKIAGIILVASIIIWALGYFPRTHNDLAVIDGKIEKLEVLLSETAHNSITGDVINLQSHSDSLQSQLSTLHLDRISRHQELSYIGRIGKLVEPVMSPLGFDWKMTIGIISGVAAKEIVIGTLGVLYLADEQDSDGSQSLTSKLQAQEYTSGSKVGKKVFNPLVAMSFMLFILIYFPCIGVLAAVRKEAGHWKWAVFMAVYTTALAWIISFAFYQIALLFL